MHDVKVIGAVRRGTIGEGRTLATIIQRVPVLSPGVVDEVRDAGKVMLPPVWPDTGPWIRAQSVHSSITASAGGTS